MRKIVTLTLSLVFLAPLITSAQWTKTSGPPGMNVNVFTKKDQRCIAALPRKVFLNLLTRALTGLLRMRVSKTKCFLAHFWSTYLYAGTDDGVYRSNNMALHGGAANSGIQGQFIYSFLAANGYLFAGSISFGVFKSQRSWNTWTDANGGALEVPRFTQCVFLHPTLLQWLTTSFFTPIIMVHRGLSRKIHRFFFLLPLHL